MQQINTLSTDFTELSVILTEKRRWEDITIYAHRLAKFLSKILDCLEKSVSATGMVSFPNQMIFLESHLICKMYWLSLRFHQSAPTS